MAKRKTYQEKLGISEDMLQADFRWPRMGDQAIQKNENWRANAPLEQAGNARLVLMSEGYKMGADAMVEEALGDNYKSATLFFTSLPC